MSEQTEAFPEKKPRLALLLATGFGLGYLPVAPGTWGSLLGLSVWWLLPAYYPMSPFLHPWSFGFFGIGRYALGFSAFIRISATVLIAAAGTWASHHVASYFSKSDPQEIVIDEISGQMIAVLSIGWMLGGIDSDDLTSARQLVVLSVPNWKYLVTGFILFRVFDIWKPFPIRRVEKLPGGWGIMADDWVAGVYAAGVLWLVRWSGWMG